MTVDPCTGGSAHFAGCPCHEAKAEALAKALKPFIQAFEGTSDDDDSLWDSDPASPEPLTIGAFRSARAALAAWRSEEVRDA